MSYSEMAESGAGAAPKWPGVSVSDETPASISVILKIPGLDVKRNLIGQVNKKEAKNADINISLDTKLVDAKIKVTDKEGAASEFEYKKKMPEDIDTKTSKWEIFKEERIKLHLVKAKNGSWERHEKYLQTPDKV